jgi:hypothetical protein
LSTLAVEGSGAVAEERDLPVLRYLDLALLAVALPVFVVADLPLLGYAVAAAAWLAQRGIQLAATRRSSRALAAGDRRSALGFIAGATLGRVWLVTLAILLVGLLAERDDGLAAAVLAAALFTAYLAGEGLARLFAADGSR